MLECAFLAGVVKGPFRYNPFVGRTKEKRDVARARARMRTHYVIDRMLANGYLTLDEASELKAQRLEFKKGEFRYDQSVILDYVFDRIQDERFSKLLEEHGIENPAVAGIRVYTTIDREFQTAAEYGLRHNLTELGSRLEGAGLSAFFAETEPILPINPDGVVLHGYYKGRVAGKTLEGEGALRLDVDLGGVVCTVDRAGIRRVADVLVQAKKKNTWSRASKAVLLETARRIPEGQNVLVSINRITAGGDIFCDLETSPELQGAVVVLDRGRIRAMVGGQDNRNFNRATTALRQFGSTFKPLTYAAARTLGWGTLSPLDNRRQGFYFQRQWYWPRPDHTGVTPYVSIVQAGTTSENVATVSLLYHLTDRLDDDQLKDLAYRAGMAPEVAESTADYARRIRDTYGILPDDESWAEGLFDQAKRDLGVELAFGSRRREVGALDHLMYGRGFEREREATRRSVRSADERRSRYAFLDRGFLQLEALAPKALADAETLLASLPPEPPAHALPGAIRSMFDRTMKRLAGSEPLDEANGRAAVVDPGALERALAHFYVRETEEGKRLIYSQRGRPEWTRPERNEVLELLAGRAVVPVPESGEAVQQNREEDSEEGSAGGASAPVSSDEPAVEDGEPGSGVREGGIRGLGRALFGGKREKPTPDPAEVILLEDTISPATVNDIRAELDRRLQATTRPAKYDLQRLIHNREFRVMLGLQYIIRMARTMGVDSSLRPVLSMTLGANEITLLEAALIYQAFLEGTVYSFDGIGPNAAIIERIEDAEGRTIYQLAESQQEVLDASVAASIGRILRQVVLHGTGRRARDAVRVASPDPGEDEDLEQAHYVVPLFGKTGTTNSFANTAFVGFVPAPRRKGREIPYGQALTVGTYVGYDDNRPMKRGSIRAHGSSGALPAWIATAQGVVRDLDLAQILDLDALHPGDTVPVAWPRDMAAVAISATTGLRAGTGILLPEEDVPEGCLSYEVYGFADGSGWQEREAYLPFTPWGQQPKTGFLSNRRAIREYPLGKGVTAAGSSRPPFPP